MTDTPASAPVSGVKRIELTLRALVLGCILAVIFTAANTYLGIAVALLIVGNGGGLRGEVGQRGKSEQDEKAGSDLE